MSQNNMNQEAQLPATVGQRGIQVRSIEDLWRFSQIVARSGFYPKDYENNPAKIAVAIQFGLEVGLKQSSAIWNIAVINGRPAVYGDAALALCMTSKDWVQEAFKETIEYDENGSPVAASCTVQRKGCQPITRTFTMEQAKRAGLAHREIWRAYPERMLQMRARAWALRDAFPDVLKGLSIREEIEDQSSDDAIEAVAETEEKSGTERLKDLLCDVHTPNDKKTAKGDQSQSSSD